MPVYPVTLLSDGDSLYSRETLLGIFGTPEETCLIMRCNASCNNMLHIWVWGHCNASCKTESYCAYECVVWRMWVMWVSHVSESCDMYAGVMSRIRECVYSGMSHDSSSCLSHDSSSCLSHVPSSCLSHEWVYSGMSQPKMSHVTRMDESCDTHEDDTHEEEDLGACHFQKQVVWQRWTSYVTRMNASRHTFE